MKILFDETGSVSAFEENLAEITSDPEVKSVCIFSCDANNLTRQQLDPILTGCKVDIFGGIFPQIIHQTEHFDKGSLFIGLPYCANVRIIPELSNENYDYEEEIDRQFKQLDNIQTMFVYVDGLAKCISTFIDSIYNVFGVENNYIGGGAGSLSFQQKPCIITGQGLIEDAAVLAALEQPSQVAVGHGWETFDGNHQVTRVHKNVIKEIDFQNAFSVYKQIVEPDVGQTLTIENFFDISKAYPFGIIKINNEKVVRDPIATNENGELICVGELKEGDYVDILNAKQQNLIDAAKHTAEKVNKNGASRSENQLTIFIDCISRALFLENNFNQEISAVYNTLDKPEHFAGALVLGEIANRGQEYLEFYNKTSVVAQL